MIPPTVLYSATSASLSNRQKYPYVYRSIPNGVSVYNGPYLWIIKNYGWRRLAVVYDPNDAFTAVCRFTLFKFLPCTGSSYRKHLLQGLPKSVVLSRHRLEDINKRTVEINTTILSEVIDKEAKNLIENLKDEDIRIIIVDAFEGDARRIFCEAYKAGFYGPDMFWMLPGWYNPKWWRLESDVEGCTTEEIAMVVETSLPLGMDVSPLSTVNNVTVAGITPLEFQDEMRRRLQWPKYEGITENGYMSYSFDAVWSIGLMLNKTVQVLRQRNSSLRLEDFSYNDPTLTEIFLEEFATTRFFGASVSLYIIFT
ncbi:Gamma-aminobutyric acid type B receptor subunit 2 [Holothuria leucospilota]|uniref:Gamma-aminobutyric acid type B receptor subunit 2 n=1 Tax=Holothuria leucospilota TaxID=206669 RepID=A0A9Q1CFR4_HOLLE|nr:Gamma-aminobutyric acid type B receptor subunit 2 [Holothuria leucospilota]